MEGNLEEWSASCPSILITTLLIDVGASILQVKLNLERLNDFPKVIKLISRPTVILGHNKLSLFPGSSS